MQGIVVTEWSYRIGDSPSFIEALTEGASVEMSFKGKIHGFREHVWNKKSDRLTGLADAVEFLNCKKFLGK